MKTRHDPEIIDFESIRVAAATGPAFARLAGLPSAQSNTRSPRPQEMAVEHSRLTVMALMPGVSWEPSIVVASTILTQTDAVVVAWEPTAKGRDLSVAVAFRTGEDVDWCDSYRIWLAEDDDALWLVPDRPGTGTALTVASIGIQAAEAPFNDRDDRSAGLVRGRNAMVRQLLAALHDDPVDTVVEVI